LSVILASLKSDKFDYQMVSDCDFVIAKKIVHFYSQGYAH